MMNEVHLRAATDWTEDSVHLFATPSAVAKSAFFYVQEAGHFKTRPKYYTEREYLPSYLAVYTVSGTGYLHYAGKHYVLKPGSVFLIDCEKYQYYETDRNDLWEILWVHFYGGTSRGYYEQFQSFGDPVVELPAATPVPGIIRELVQLHQHQDARTELLCSRLIVELLTEILLHSTQRGWGDAAGGMPDYMIRIADFIAKNFDRKILLDQLSAEFAVSKYHLIREFKKYFGLAPIEFVISTRLSKAKQLLKYTDMSVADIALSVGFDNVSHFIGTFKKHESATPLVFRKQWRTAGI